MALYLTYRPKTFDELVKQDHITNILKPKVLNDDYAHSNFLFYGPRGTGKTSTARIFAKAINCSAPQEGNPCNTCDNCLAINANKTIDVVEIDAASHTQVDNIREEIIDKAPYPPSHLKKKVYIIDEVHMLSKNAFNALLKIMEEPPSYLVFILATTEIHKIPETIISRCQVFTFKKIPVADLVKHLTFICNQENIGYDPQALISIAKISDGCARDAIKYVDQVSILGDITQEHVSSFLGVASDQLVSDFLTACIAKDKEASFTIIDALHASGIDIANFVKQCLLFIEEHFSDNPSGYIMCTEIFARISYGIKNFPIPTILMKMELYNAFTPKEEQKQKEKEGIPHVAKMHTANTTTSKAEDATISNTAAPSSTGNSLSEDETIDEVSEKSALFTDSTETTPTAISSGLSIADLITQTPTLPQQLQHMLLDSCVLEEHDDKTFLYIFNKMQAHLIQKAENMIPLETAYKQITGKNYGIQPIVTTKEEYFASKL